MNENHNLTTFSSPFITFRLVQYNDKEKFSIELGEDSIDETDLKKADYRDNSFL